MPRTDLLALTERVLSRPGQAGSRPAPPCKTVGTPNVPLSHPRAMGQRDNGEKIQSDQRVMVSHSGPKQGSGQDTSKRGVPPSIPPAVPPVPIAVPPLGQPRQQPGWTGWDDDDPECPTVPLPMGGTVGQQPGSQENQSLQVSHSAPERTGGWDTPADFLQRAAEAAHAALAVPDPDLANERAATAMAQAAEAAGAFGQTRPEADHQAALAGFQAAALLRPPAWSDHASIPPPGACCACCKGQRWWSPRDPRADGTGPGPGWRCTTCRPPSPGVAVTVLDTAPCRRRPRFAAQGSTR